jgi:hypothetical protein
MMTGERSTNFEDEIEIGHPGLPRHLDFGPSSSFATRPSSHRESAVRLFCLLVAALALSPLALAQAPSPIYFGIQAGASERVKARLAAGDESLQPALKTLQAEADQAAQSTPPSVVQKTRLPPSGDKHDSLSQAPYFWPNPDGAHALPYIRRDGEVNPESRGPASDHERMGRMAGTIETLALAYYFTGKNPYAEQAARRLKVWFLDPATRMNPNLNFAQGIPGLNDGRGTGIIEGRAIAEAADAAGLLAGSPAWTPGDDAALHAWLGTYLDWLLTSPHGRDEAHARNNHGTFYDVQALRLALVLGKTDLAKRIAEEAKQKRIAVQIEPDGRQPLELERATSFGYSLFNLQALFALATLAEHAGVDLWDYATPDGRSMRGALDFMVPFVDVPAKKWPYKQIKKLNPNDIAPVLRQAALVYHAPKYEKILAQFRDTSGERFQLLCPKSQPQPNP